jgi:cell volume regulation protein A
MSTMDYYVVLASVLAIAVILSTRLAQRFGVPALVLFVAIGMLAGTRFYFADYSLSLNLGLLALALILFSGGLDTRMRLFRAAVLPASLLATFGVFIKMLVLGGAAYLVTPLNFIESLLLGAVLAPTDAAAVFSVLRGKGLPPRLKGVIEAESGTNDPVSIYLTVALTSVVLAGQMNYGNLLLGIVTQLALGALLGYLFGRALVWLINRVTIDSFGLYPVLALAGGLLAFSLTNLVGGNGFLAIYLVGLVMGNRVLSHKQNIMRFMDGMAWGAQIMMFLLLGLLVFPDQLLPAVPVALFITFFLMFVARPVSVFVCLAPLKRFTGHYAFTWKEQALVSWAGLKGAVPIILAIVPLLNQVPAGLLIFNIVFVVVVVATALQGLTVVPVARWLGLLQREPPEPPLRLELGGAAPPGTAVYDVYLQNDQSAVGKSLSELDLPQHIVIAAIYRRGQMIPPRGNTRFEVGDHVFIINAKAETMGIPPEFIVKRSKVTGKREREGELDDATGAERHTPSQ